MSTKKRPAIGVTTDRVPGKEQYLSNYTYAAAVERAGGLPFLLPFKIDHALVGDYLEPPGPAYCSPAGPT